MVKRLSELPEAEGKHLAAMRCPSYEDTPGVPGKPLSERRIAIVSTAGLHRRGDRAFSPGDGGYRIIPGETNASNLMMSHISVNFDRTGFQQDSNLVFPIDRLRELAEAGAIGSLADMHYSFMGANAPDNLEPAARQLAPLLIADRVDGVLLVPV